MSEFYSWFILILAGLFEVGFTTCLKYSENFSKPWPSVAFLICAGLSFWLLNKSTATITLGTAYAAWTGIGVIGTVIVGVVWFGDATGAARLFFLTLLIVAIIGLKISA